MRALKVILLVIVAVPVALVLVGVMLYQRERRVLRSAVRALVCPSCSARLSGRSIQVAGEACFARTRVRERIAGAGHARCTRMT